MKPTKEQLEACKNKLAQSFGYKDIQEYIAAADTGTQIEELIDKVALEYNNSELRDYFAAKAMQGISTDPSFGNHGNEPYAEVLARTAYEVADAMLKQRQ